jgi:hypothetical protein
VTYLGDTFVLGGIDRLVAGFRAGRPDAQIMLTRVKDPSAFEAAELGPDGRVMRLEEKPAHPRSDLALVGVCRFGPAVHDAVAAISPSPRGELEITDAIQWLIDHRRRARVPAAPQVPGGAGRDGPLARRAPRPVGASAWPRRPARRPRRSEEGMSGLPLTGAEGIPGRAPVREPTTGARM